jgi:hypothetical protein
LPPQARLPPARCEAGRFQRQLIFVSTHILSESASAPAEYLITRLKLRYVSADHFNLPGQINSRACRFWFAQPGHCANDVRLASHEAPVKWIDGSRANLEHQVIHNLINNGVHERRPGGCKS